MTFEPTRRHAFRVVFAGLVASCATNLRPPTAAALSHKASRSEYRAHYRALFKACGNDQDKKMLVGKQLLDNYVRDACVYQVPDHAAVARMHAALLRQHHARRIGVSS